MKRRPVVALVLAIAGAVAGCTVAPSDENDLGFDEGALTSAVELKFPSLPDAPDALPLDRSTKEFTVPVPASTAGKQWIPAGAFRVYVPGHDMYPQISVRPVSIERFRGQYTPAEWEGAIDPIVAMYKLDAQTGDGALAMSKGRRSPGSKYWTSAELTFGETSYGNVLEGEYIAVVWHYQKRTPFGAKARHFVISGQPLTLQRGPASVCVEPGPGYPRGPDCLKAVPLDQAECAQATGGPYSQCTAYRERPVPFGGGG